MSHIHGPDHVSSAYSLLSPTIRKQQGRQWYNPRSSATATCWYSLDPLNSSQDPMSACCLSAHSRLVCTCSCQSDGSSAIGSCRRRESTTATKCSARRNRSSNSSSTLPSASCSGRSSPTPGTSAAAAATMSCSGLFLSSRRFKIAMSALIFTSDVISEVYTFLRGGLRFVPHVVSLKRACACERIERTLHTWEKRPKRPGFGHTNTLN